jgi:hypothetical protein
MAASTVARCHRRGPWRSAFAVLLAMAVSPYCVTPARIGTSSGLRLPAAFYRDTIPSAPVLPASFRCWMKTPFCCAWSQKSSSRARQRRTACCSGSSSIPSADRHSRAIRARCSTRKPWPQTTVRRWCAMAGRSPSRFAAFAESWNGRLAMLSFVIGHQIGLGALLDSYAPAALSFCPFASEPLLGSRPHHPRPGRGLLMVTAASPLP